MKLPKELQQQKPKKKEKDKKKRYQNNVPFLVENAKRLRDIVY